MRELTEAERARAREVSTEMRVRAIDLGLRTSDASIVQMESGRAAVVMNLRVDQEAFDA